MKIFETNIPDVTEKNIDESKQILADNIIRNVYPLFNEVLGAKVEQVKELEDELRAKRAAVTEKKEILENLNTSYKRKQKEAKLLSRVEKLVNSGLVYDGTLKNEITILLRIVDKIPEDKLDYHLKETLKVIHKRFRS